VLQTGQFMKGLTYFKKSIPFPEKEDVGKITVLS
jgi:hypothetical protein